MPNRSSLSIFLSFVMMFTLSNATLADQTRHETKFRVKFSGLTVGHVTFGVDVDGNDYTLTGNGKTGGLAEWFAPGKALIKSSGALDGKKLVAADHHIKVTEKKKVSVLDMKFSDGDVESVFLKPDKRKKNKTAEKYILLTPDHLKSVVDPASTLIVPIEAEKARNPEAVCGRLLKVYDGETRFDIKLSYKRNRKITTAGYDGYAYVCKLKYIPVAGHKIKHSSVKRMSKNDDMEIWLAPIDGGEEDQSVFTAIRIYVPTWIGTFSAEPEYFGPAKS